MCTYISRKKKARWYLKKDLRKVKGAPLSNCHIELAYERTDRQTVQVALCLKKVLCNFPVTRPVRLLVGWSAIIS